MGKWIFEKTGKAKKGGQGGMRPEKGKGKKGIPESGLVIISYVDGDVATVETTREPEWGWHFMYNRESDCFIVNDSAIEADRMMVPKSFVRNICVLED